MKPNQRINWRRIRTSVRAGHKWAGLVAALPILILSITGSLLAFEPELQAFEERRSLHVPVPEQGPEARLAISEQIARIAPAMREARVQLYSLPGQPHHAALIRLTDKRFFFVNPYTAEITGETKLPAPIMTAIRVLHTSFFMGEFGTWVGILASLAFCFLAISGCVLFFKRRGGLLRKSHIELRKGPGRRNYDLHAVIGFYSGGILSLIALSGALIGMGEPWRNFILAITDSEFAERPVLEQELDPATPHLPPEQLLEQMNAAAPKGLLPTTLIFPTEANAPFVVRYTFTWANRPASFGYLHPTTGEILAFHHFPEFETGHLIHRLNRGFHSGELFTDAMRWLWFLLMWAPPGLIITGILIWRLRRGV